MTHNLLFNEISRFRFEFFFFIVLLIGGCNTKVSKSEGKLEPSSEFRIDYGTIKFTNDLDTIICDSVSRFKNSSSILFHFNRSCSYCILKYIIWSKNLQENDWSNSFNLIDVSFGSEYQTLLYYLEKTDVKPLGCLLDTSELFEKNNTDIMQQSNANGGVGIYLIESLTGKILAIGDPFQDQTVFKIYKKILENSTEILTQ